MMVIYTKGFADFLYIIEHVTILRKLSKIISVHGQAIRILPSRGEVSPPSPGGRNFFNVGILRENVSNRAVAKGGGGGESPPPISSRRRAP